ncbi:RNA polymerase recycling motor HelD [Solibacillus silvestris]|uniref:RNA polymerase recycling motor HelD n=1 Tax=Solibacillus silvestris TaxID=76853 RepID=UPI003F8012D6
MHVDFLEEQKRLNDVTRVITDQILQVESEMSNSKNEVVNIRKHFWDEIKVNTDTFDDFLETIISLRQETQALSVSQSTYSHVAKRLATLRRMQTVPYFGRIDFLEEGYTAEEHIYIGISSLMDESKEDFLIYDWRAPISSVYYDYEPGPAQYKTPGGMIYGELEKKWQYVIRARKLQSMFDTSITIGDEILQQVLGKGTDKYMQNIVATIQKEQNRIIRHDQGRLLIVQGAAGSGKTSAALQRIAFLLYKYRDHLKADQIVLFSPNAMFNSYVSNVLPELGEENMQQVTFQEYLDHRLSKEFQLENPFDQLEYVLTASNTSSYKTRIKGIRFKASGHFFEAIKLYRETLEKSGMLFKDIKFRGNVIVPAQQLANRFYGNDISLNFHGRLEKLKEWLMNHIKEIEKVERLKPWAEEEIELLSNETSHKIHKYLAEKKGFAREEMADYEMDHEALIRVIVRQKLKPLKKRVQALDFIDIEGVYKQLFSDPLLMRQLKVEVPEEWGEICQATLQMLGEGKLYYEDATPFLLLQELIQGFQTNRSIKHILIDEAQDYSPFQFEFLKRLFPSAQMTVLGDFNQAIFAHASEIADFQVLNNLYGENQTEVINMSRSYRSTKPIIEFTSSLIANGEKIIPFERAGELPVLTEVKNHTELHRCIQSKVSALQSEGYESIAIICISAEQSKAAFEALMNQIDGIKLLKYSSAEYEQGVVVIPTYLAKGIEFEAVIIYDAAEQIYGEESLRRIFYTACTRAMHELQLYSVGKPSPFLQKAVQENSIRMELDY